MYQNHKFCSVLFHFLLLTSALVISWVHFHRLKEELYCNDTTCRGDAVVQSSLLHSVVNTKLKYYNFKTAIAGLDESDSYSIYDLIEATKKSKLELFTGELNADGNKKVKITMDPTDTTANPDWIFSSNATTDKTENFALYAMGCSGYNSNSEFVPMKTQYDTNIESGKYSDACVCFDSFMNEKTSWTDITEKKEYVKDHMNFCSERNLGHYSVEYEDSINARDLMFAGQIFLCCGLLVIIYRRVSVSIQGYISQSGYDFVYIVLSTVGLVLLSGYGLQESNDDADKLMRIRDGQFASNVVHMKVTKDGSEQMPLSNLPFTLIMTGALVQIVISIFLVYFNRHKTSKETPIVYRIATDWPLIVGFTMVGVSVMLQTGATNTTHLAIFAFILFVTCLLQHVSNVVKIFYDTVCRNTDHSVFVNVQQNSEKMDKNGPVSDEHGFLSKQQTAKKTTDVLQFFGWIRVWIFLMVTLASIFTLTLTKELVKSNMHNSNQLLFFVFAFYFANVGYDLVRELLPMQFEKHDTDSSRFYIISLYIIFYNANQLRTTYI